MDSRSLNEETLSTRIRCPFQNASCVSSLNSSNRYPFISVNNFCFSSDLLFLILNQNLYKLAYNHITIFKIGATSSTASKAQLSYKVTIFANRKVFTSVIEGRGSQEILGRIHSRERYITITNSWFSVHFLLFHSSESINTICRIFHILSWFYNRKWRGTMDFIGWAVRRSVECLQGSFKGFWYTPFILWKLYFCKWSFW